MRPKPFRPEPFDTNGRYIRNKTTGEIWHRSQLRTLYADTDRSEVVYHSNYLRYFEFGRTSLMRDAAYPYRQIEESGYVYPVIELGITFYKALYYDDLIWIHTRPVELERVKLKFDYIVTHADNGDIICRGFTTHCALNKKGMPVAVDEKTIQLWKTFPK